MAVRAIIWDFDGTLVASLAGIAAAMQKTLAEFGYAEPTEQQVRATIGLTLEESIRRLTGGRCPQERIPALVARYRALYVPSAAALTALFPGTIDVLSRLKERTIASIVVSNKGRAALSHLVTQLGLAELIAFTLSADDVVYRKPDGRLYTEHIAPRLASLAPGEILVVGDTESDLGFARAAGLTACWAKYGYGDPTTCAALQPAHTIASIDEVLNVVDLHQ